MSIDSRWKLRTENNCLLMISRTGKSYFNITLVQAYAPTFIHLALRADLFA